MDKLIFFAGIGCSVGGVALLIYQGLMYLMNNTWTQYTLLFLVDKGPVSLQNQVSMNPGIAKALESCPLFLFLIIFGLLLAFIGSRLGDRYVS